MIAAFREANALFEAEAKKNESFGKVYASWRAYRRDIFEWHRTAEAAMTNFLSNWRAEG